jgi:hypothetical protein
MFYSKIVEVPYSCYNVKEHVLFSMLFAFIFTKFLFYVKYKSYVSWSILQITHI